MSQDVEGSLLRPGDRLPRFVRRPTRVTCFLFAVAWWTPHRVHYDVEWAAHEGYRDVMVPGLLLNEYVVAAVTSWTGDPTTLRRMSVRYTAPAVAGDTLTLEPVVTEISEVSGLRTVKFAFEMLRQDEAKLLVGEATVVAPPAATANSSN